MKKLCSLIGILILSATTTAYAQNIDVYIGNKLIEMSVSPEINEANVYVPISFISSELGAVTKWQTPNVIITKDNITNICTIGRTTAYKNDVEFQLSEAPYISNDRTFVSLSTISEILDCNDNYQKNLNRIDISPNKIIGLEQHMKNLHALDYRVVDNLVYYVVLGDEEGFHKMSLDGSADVVICNFDNVTCSINGSTSITSELTDDGIIYKFQGLRQYDANGKLEEPHPIYTYKLDLKNYSLTPIN